MVLLEIVELDVKSNAAHSARRAQRSLHWYPKAWRQRFGDEYVALLEAELLERPRSARRSFNVAWKGSIARLADLGIAGSTVDSSAQVRSGAATSLFCAIFAVAASVKLWAPPMTSWYSVGHRQMGWLLKLSTGLITVVYGAMAVVVGVALIGVLCSASWRIIRGRGKGLRVPAVLMAACAAYLVVAEHIALRWLAATGGIAWTRPSVALEQIAALEYRLFAGWESAATSPSSFRSLDGIVMALAPVILLGFALAAMTLIRRTAISARMAHFYRYGLTWFVISIFTCLGSYLVWDLAGGSSNFGPLTSSFPTIQIAIVGVLALACGSALIRTRSALNRPLGEL